MRLDTLGKPLLAQSPQVVDLATEKVKRKLVDEVGSPEDSNPSFNDPTDEGKLAKILEILGRSKERNKKKLNPFFKKAKALAAYKLLDDHYGPGGMMKPRVGSLLNVRV